MFTAQHKKFGQLPRGERLERIKKSANYRDGQFKNQNETTTFTSNKNGLQIMLDFMFRKKIRLKPGKPLPVVKTDISKLKKDADVLVWFGHSSYFLQLNRKTFLIDPVFSDYASPFSFINKTFKASNSYNSEDFPATDYLIITHDHWDHLDYLTVLDLKPKVKQIICGLGVGQHFEHWDFEPSIITELDWFEGVQPGKGWQITATPARHFSGRGLKRNQTLWASYVLQSPDYNIFLGGDSGYDEHFQEIGRNYGPFDLAILEQGQYNQNWNQIHTMPDQVFKIAEELQTRQVLPVHHSKFALAKHPWDEPLNKITENQQDLNIAILTPKIGEPVFLNHNAQSFRKWWNEIE